MCSGAMRIATSVPAMIWLCPKDQRRTRTVPLWGWGQKGSAALAQISASAQPLTITARRDSPVSGASRVCVKASAWAMTRFLRAQRFPKR